MSNHHEPNVSPEQAPTGVSATTVVWGLVLLVIAGLAVLTALTPIALDPVITLGCLLIGSGVALVGFAAIGGRRTRPE